MPSDTTVPGPLPTIVSPTESPQAIIDDIVAGMGSSREDVHVIVDRREAIERAIGMARPGDAVVIAGKGHESTQTIGDTVVEFDDVMVARQIVGVTG